MTYVTFNQQAQKMAFIFETAFIDRSTIKVKLKLEHKNFALNRDVRTLYNILKVLLSSANN